MAETIRSGDSNGLRATMGGSCGGRLFFLFLLLTTDIICADRVNSFIKDISHTFGLRNPTIIYHGNAPDICFRNQWVLCLNLENEQSILQKAKDKHFW